MLDGVYKISFETAQGTGAGVIMMTGTNFVGGDGAMIYRGSYEQSGNDMKVTARVFRHTQGPPSVLGVDTATLKLSGTADDSHGYLKGSADEAPGVYVNVEIRRIGDL